MNTALYNPNEANIPPIGMPAGKDSKAGRNLGKRLRSHLLSLSSTHSGNLAPALSEAGEDDLISAAQMGDQRAFMELCSRHSGLTRRRIFKILRNHEDTEDALQDTLLRAYTHLTSFRRSCKFATWLTAIGVNAALMAIRKRKARKESSVSPTGPEGKTLTFPDLVDRSPGPEALYATQQAILILRRELKKLKPTLRCIVDHYYGTECSLEEAAEEHEISLGAAKSRLLRGRERLRSSLARHGLSKIDN